MGILAERLLALGVDMETLLLLPALILPVVELVKKHLNVKGKNLLLASLLSSFIWSLLLYAPAASAVLTATFIGFLGASGGLQLIKRIAGEVGVKK